MAITTHPTSQTVPIGQTVTFEAVYSEVYSADAPWHTGDTHRYATSQYWQRSTNGGSSWSNIDAATDTTYSHTVASGEHGYQYRCVFSVEFETYDSGSEDFSHTATESAATNAATLLIAYGEDGTLVDNGFEGRTDGTSLDDAIWTDSGSPQNAEYDTAQAKMGSVSALIKGPATTTYGGAYTSATENLTGDGAEVRFWLKFDTANQARIIRDEPNSATLGAYLIQFGTDGSVAVLTSRTKSGYRVGGNTPVGYGSTWAGFFPGTAWWQYRMVFDFTMQTYTLSVRQNLGDSWQPLRGQYLGVTASDDAIPFRGTDTIAHLHNAFFRGYNGSQLWVDDLRYSSSAISDIPAGLPEITTQPSSQEVLPDGTMTLTVAHTTVYPTPTVKWQRSTNGGSSWSDIDGATSLTYSKTVDRTENGYQYRAVLTNTYGSVTSDVATLTCWILGPRFIVDDSVDHTATDCAITLPNGRMMVFTRVEDGQEGSHTGNTSYIAVRYTDDNGATISGRTTIYNSAYDDRNISAGVLATGRVVVVFRRYDAANAVTIDRGIIYSDDLQSVSDPADATWSTYTAHDCRTFFGEISRHSDGRYYAAGYTTSETRLYWSSDGITWSNANSVIVHNITNATEPSIIEIGAGRMICLTRNDQQLIDNGYSWTGDWGFLCHLSTDNGATWTQVDDVPTEYFSIAPHFKADYAAEKMYLFYSERRSNTDPNDASEVKGFSADFADLTDPSTAFTEEFRFPRSQPSDRNFIGMPFVANSVDGVAVGFYSEVIWDPYPSEDQDIYGFTVHGPNLLNAWGLTADQSGGTVTLNWYGTADIYRANHPNVDATDTLIVDGSSAGTATDEPGMGTWYYRALLGESWTAEVEVTVTETVTIGCDTIRATNASASLVADTRRATAVTVDEECDTARPVWASASLTADTLRITGITGGAVCDTRRPTNASASVTGDTRRATRVLLTVTPDTRRAITRSAVANADTSRFVTVADNEVVLVDTLRTVYATASPACDTLRTATTAESIPADTSRTVALTWAETLPLDTLRIVTVTQSSQADTDRRTRVGVLHAFDSLRVVTAGLEVFTAPLRGTATITPFADGTSRILVTLDGESTWES